MKPILIPTDFSDKARQAALYAQDYMRGQAQAGRVVLLNAYLPSSAARSSEQLILSHDEARKRSKEGLSQELQRFQERGLHPGICCEALSHMGKAENVIAYLVKEHDFRLVMMGQGESGQFGRFRNMGCPLFLIPPQAAYQGLKNIFFLSEADSDLSSIPERVYREALGSSPEHFFIGRVSESAGSNGGRSSDWEALYSELPRSFLSLRAVGMVEDLARHLEEKKADLLVCSDQSPELPRILQSSHPVFSRLPLLLMKAEGNAGEKLS